LDGSAILVEETLGPGTTIVGLQLYPEAASSLLGLPTSELADLTLDATSSGGSLAARLRCQRPGEGSQISNRVPSGSTAHPKRPYSDSSSA